MVPTIPRIELRMDDLERLVERARHTPLSDDEYDTLKAAIHTLGYVAQLVEEKGTPLPYFRSAIIAPVRASYLSGPTPSGGGAVKITPHRWQRSFSSA